MYRRCMKIMQDHHSALDAMQDVFTQLLLKKKSITNDGMASLLYQMATNTSLNMLRHRKVRADFQENQIKDSDENHVLTNSLEELTINLNLIGSIVKEFPARSCEVAIYHYVDGYTLDEVADLMKISKSTVRRALKDLKESLSHWEKI